MIDYPRYDDQYRARMAEEREEICALRADPETRPIVGEDIRPQLEARAAVWLATLAEAFRLWDFEWQEPVKEKRQRLMLPGEVILTWKHPGNDKHLVVLFEDDKTTSTAFSTDPVVYYAYGTSRRFDGECTNPLSSYLLWYWYFY